MRRHSGDAVAPTSEGRRGHRAAGRRARSERATELRTAALSLPAVVLVLLFVALPLGLLVVRSFTEFQASEQGGGAWANYAWVLGNEVNVRVLIRTFATAALVTLVVLVLAYPFAYVMSRVPQRWRGVLFGVVMITFWTSAVIRNYSWLILFQRNGLVNTVLRAVGLEPVQILGTTTAVVIGMAHFMLPFALLPIYTSLRSIDSRLVLAAQSLGARPSTAFWRIYFPLSIPGVLAGGLLVFVLCLGFYITPAILGSPQNSLYAQLLVTQISNLLAWGRGGAMGVILFAVTMLLLGISALLLGSKRKGARG